LIDYRDYHHQFISRRCRKAAQQMTRKQQTIRNEQNGKT